MKPKKYILERPQTAPVHDYTDELDEEQLAMVTAPPGHLLAVAGAGSGKTRALTYRVAHLLRTGTPPERLLLCTFTNRAAREMLRRVESLASVHVERLWAGTFHHVGNLVLRRYADRLGRTSDFAILDRADAVDLLGRVIAERPRAARQKRFPQANVLLGLLSLAAGTQRSVASLLEVEYARFGHFTKEIQEVARAYRDRKRRLNLVDFDDLLGGWLESLTEHPDIAAELQDRFLHVLVDEYQDVNRIQVRLTDLMAEGHGSLTVVGDDDQSIYGFRGADVSAMLTFAERHPDTRIFKIQTNYRSTPEILALANRSIAHNRKRHEKTLRAVRPQGELPVVVSAEDVYQQAAFVAQRVLELQDEQCPLKEMGVLFRAHSHSLELQVELTRRQIPFTVRAGLRFFEQAHIKDALAHLRWVVNPADELAAHRVLRLQPGIGATIASRVVESLTETEPAALHLGLQTAQESVSGRARERLARLVTIFGEMAVAKGPAPALRQVVATGYKTYAEQHFTNADTRLDDLDQLARYAERYESIATFLDEITLMAGMAAEGFAPGQAPDDAITLTTVHQAKGLEWRVVFVLWLADGHFPSALALRDPDGEEEERRLFYVAATRARDQLYGVYPILTESGGVPNVLTRPSRFTAELEGQELFERWQIELDAE